MVMDFAAAVNAEARDLEAAGADVIQLDDPWLRNDPGGGEAHRGARAQPRARGAEGARPSCISASAMPPSCPAQKPDRLFVPAAACGLHGRADFDRGRAAQARSRRACATLPARPSCSASSISATRRSRSPEVVAGRIRGGAEIRRCQAARSGARLRHEVSHARGGVRQAEGAGGRCRDCSGRSGLRRSRLIMPAPPIGYRLSRGREAA